ncbi:VOC family protein [Halobacillus litoralis]|uniref:VOC family protein n=1 Tax=Halobacillus litoralis TaxID=45668 RepID=UPI001CD306D4|nr:VOC family protein [Halobacillus litoralis]MCA0970190.1 VOC family protein [Halobacillus litoralis]
MAHLRRVGTTYLPVQDVRRAADWYEAKLGARLNFIDDEKAIVEMAGQSFFLVLAEDGATANFRDRKGHRRFSLTFEVDGMDELEELRESLQERHVIVGDVEDRGHMGNNFVFYDLCGNVFDVWSELSP